ncbi:VOC family protein [Nesterenkonia salmonea]|uniref:VOC family protein n=1 Tax=Nesterenkonia salmonea TaxID=1804987 RepID=UPI001AA04C0F|nr:VOC family protein [Nesterenkonia salmonea]
MTYLLGSHHVTLSVGKAQEDVDFHTKVLGMRVIGKNVCTRWPRILDLTPM